MPTIAAGSSTTVFCPLAGTITVTPGSAGRVSLQSRSVSGGQSAVPRELYAAETIAIAAGDTLTFEAINTDATYITPAGADSSASALVSDPWIMPAPSGASDNALFIDAISSGRKVIRLRVGTYLVSSAISALLTNQQFIGQSKFDSIIKVADGSNVAQNIFGCASGSVGVTFQDLTFDGNGANQTSGSNALIDTSTNTPEGVTLRGCILKNVKGTSGAINFLCANAVIENNIFQDNFEVDLRFDTGCNGARVVGNYFTNWNASLNALRSSVWILSTAQNILFQGNRWKNVRASVFAIESIPGSGIWSKGITIVDNIFDGGGFRGCGISGVFDGAIITNNRFLNGGEEAGVWSLGHRAGMEVAGRNNTIQGNYIENGSIAVMTGAGVGRNTNSKILNNMIRGSFSTATAIQQMNALDCDDLIISGNTIEVTLSGSATVNASILLANYAINGTLSRVRCVHNTLRMSGTASGAGIRLAGTSTTDVSIEDNTISGYSDGFRVATGTADVNLSLRRNNLWNNTARINGTPTGLGYVDRDNIKFTGQYSAQTVASGAAPTLNCGIGSVVLFTATSAATWGAPSNVPGAGDTITVRITQDGTGGWAISWNAAYVFPTAWSNTGNTAGKVSTIVFVSDGTKLVAQGANSWY